MRTLDLEFSRPQGLNRVAATACLAAGVLALAVVLLRIGMLNAEIGQLTNSLDDARRAGRHDRLPLTQSAQDKENTARELERANLVVARLNIGWAALFRQLEAVQMPTVKLLALQPESGAAKRLRLSGEARRLDDALDYVKRLGAAPGLRNAHLISHELVVDGPRRAVRFALVVDWLEQP